MCSPLSAKCYEEFSNILIEQGVCFVIQANSLAIAVLKSTSLEVLCFISGFIDEFV